MNSSNKTIQKISLHISLSFPSRLIQYDGGHKPHRLIFTNYEQPLTGEFLQQLIKRIVAIPVKGLGIIQCGHPKLNIHTHPIECKLTGCLPTVKIEQVGVMLGTLVTLGWTLDEAGLRYHKVSPVMT